MSRSRPRPTATFSERLCRRILVLLPRQFRQDFGAQIEQAVRDRARYDRPGSRPGPLFWAELLLDLLRTATLERLESLMSPDAVARYGGPLAAIGGSLWLGSWTLAATRAVDESSIYPVLLISIVAIAACLATIAVSRHLPGERLRLSSAVFGALGVIALAAGIVTDVWFLTVGGIYSVLLATLLAALSMLVAAWLPPFYGGVAIVASMAMFVANTENWQIWLMAPFGAAWLLVGYGLWILKIARLTPAG